MFISVIVCMELVAQIAYRLTGRKRERQLQVRLQDAEKKVLLAAEAAQQREIAVAQRLAAQRSDLLVERTVFAQCWVTARLVRHEADARLAALEEQLIVSKSDRDILRTNNDALEARAVDLERSCASSRNEAAVAMVQLSEVKGRLSHLTGRVENENKLRIEAEQREILARNEAEQQENLARERIESFERRLECVVCMDSKVDCVLLPCGHLVLCLVCAEHVFGLSGPCPMCRRRISAIHRTYFNFN